MSISVEDLRAVPDEEWDDLYLEVVREQERRVLLATAPGRVDELLGQVREAVDGSQPAVGAPVGEDGQPTGPAPVAYADAYPDWRAPSGVWDAYPQGWIVRHGGRLWLCLLSGTRSEPGSEPGLAAWSEVTPGQPATDGDSSGGGEPEVKVPEWEAGHAYLVGDVVSSQGHRWRCVTAHVSLPDWPPATTPMAWTRLD